MENCWSGFDIQPNSCGALTISQENKTGTSDKHASFTVHMHCNTDLFQWRRSPVCRNGFYHTKDYSSVRLRSYY